jgi:O-antigen ligase
MKEKIIIWLTIIFIGTINLGIDLFAVNLTIILGLFVSIVYFFFTKIRLSKKYIYYALLLIFTIIYASFIDFVNDKFNLYILISKIYIVVFGALIVSYFSKIKREVFDYIIIKSNIILTVINFFILIFAIIPSLSIYVMSYDQNGIRLKGFSSDVNGLAMDMVFTLSIVLYSLFVKKNPINFINLILTILISIMTQSRGLYVAFVIQLLIFLYFFYRKRSIKFLIIKFSKIIILIITFFIMFPMIIQILDDNYGIKLSRFSENSDANVSEISVSSARDERGYLFKAGLNTISNNPLGIGYSDNHIIIGENTNIFLLPHNFFISIFLYYGIIFGILWLLLFIMPLIILYKRKNKINTMLIAFFISFIISLSVFISTHSSDSVYIWVFLAMSLGVINNKDCYISTNRH